MYIVKNALRSIFRSKGRSILILIIALVITLSACVTLSIRQSAVRAKESGLEDLEITAQIAVNRQSLMQGALGERGQGGKPDMSAMQEVLQGARGLSLEELKVYAAAPSVKSFYYTLTASLNGRDLEPIDLSGTASGENGGTGEGGDTGEPGGFPDRGGMGGGMFGTQGDFTLVGAGSDAALTDFVNGTCSIVEGSMFEEGTEAADCVISDELALLNGLSVGDTVTLANPNNEEETVSFTVVGIYQNSVSGTQDSGVMGGFSPAGDAANRLYVSYPVLRAFTDASEAAATTETDEETGMTQSTAVRAQVAGTYVFASLEEYNAFEEEARALGLSEAYSISSTEVSRYEQSLQPLENLSKFALYFLVVVLAIGAVILIVINIFSIRERKYEIGVLTAIGMSKVKVSAQFVLEMFSITVAAVLLGAIVGGAVSVPLANSLLSSQVTSQQQMSESVKGSFGREMGSGFGGMQPPADMGDASPAGRFMGGAVDYIKEVNAAVDMAVLLELLGIGVLLTLISSSAALIFILRYEPLKILSNRD